MIFFLVKISRGADQGEAGAAPPLAGGIGAEVCG